MAGAISQHLLEEENFWNNVKIEKKLIVKERDRYEL